MSHYCGVQLRLLVSNIVRLARLVADNIAGALVTFQDVNPRWSVSPRRVRRSCGGRGETCAISNEACTGAYWFQSPNRQQLANARVNAGRKEAGEYYIAPLYNDLIVTQKSGSIVAFAADEYVVSERRRIWRIMSAARSLGGWEGCVSMRKSADCLTICLPLFNAEAVVERCIRAVLESCAEPYQILVVDNCSTDRTVANFGINSEGPRAREDSR